VVQINGQKKIIISTSGDKSQKEIEELVKKDPKISKILEGQKIIKTIFVKNKLINFVI
jgi:leucyl-tRNA synthetase